MRLLIDRKDLELLLEKDREYIGNNVGIDTMIAAISFLLSVFTANYSDLLGISGIVLKTVFCIIGVVYFIKTVWDIFNMIKNKYTIGSAALEFCHVFYGFAAGLVRCLSLKEF